MSDSQNKNLHSGHRERLKARFNESGFEGFADHNILELLLFYTIPRKDTNELAHRLLDTFGSLSGVFDAPFDMLVKVKGVTANTAYLITMLPSLMKKYEDDKFCEKIVINSSEKAGELCIAKFIGVTKEQFYVILMDNNSAVKKVALISEGTQTSTNICVRKIVEEVIATNASSVILAHNHPNGVAAPSGDDIHSTQFIIDALSKIDVKVHDHIIVSGRDYIALGKSEKFKFLFRR